VSLRAQPPVRSPLSAGGIIAGLRAAAAGGTEARAMVRERLSTWYRPRALALTDSGTTALAEALRLAARERPGRPVLLPAWGCYDLATAADAADVSVALYDLDPVTLGPDWDSFAQALTREPAAAVAVHFYGLPVDLERFSFMAHRAGATVISDAAQGAGALLGGRPLASWGDLAVLSFGRGKGMTGGMGGALLAHDEAWRAPVEGLTLEAPRGGPGEAIALVAQWLLTRPSLYGIPAGVPWLGLGQTVYHPPHAARDLSALAAGVLTVTMGLTEWETQRRRRNASWLIERLPPDACQSPRLLPGSTPGWLRLPLFLTGASEPSPNERLVRSLGIYPGYPIALPDLPGFGARLLPDDQSFPGARELARRLVTLPTHGAVRGRDLQQLVLWGDARRARLAVRQYSH
jgi:dTDP-4-amino-4,6-dideoxygalactose transaminase